MDSLEPQRRITIKKAKEEFFGRPWTDQEARVELKKIRRAIDRQKDIIQPESVGGFAKAAAGLLLGAAANSSEAVYTVFPTAELEAMADFLEDRLKHGPGQKLVSNGIPTPTYAVQQVPERMVWPHLNGRERSIWQCERQIYPNQGQVFFPQAPDDATYAITITGSVSYRYKTYGYPSGSSTREENFIVSGRADALHMTTLHPKYFSDDGYKDTGRFDHEHDWFRINNQAIDKFQLLDKNGRQDKWGLEADRRAHTYRLSLTNSQEPLVIAFEMDIDRYSYVDDPNFSFSGYFTVSVVAWVVDTRTIQPPDEVPVTDEEAAVTVEVAPEPRPPTRMPPETPEEFRDRWRRGIQRSSDDQRAILTEIAQGRQKQMDDLKAMELPPEMYEQYKTEIDNWTARQLARFTERGQADSGKTIG